jgi:hypothetical protein
MNPVFVIKEQAGLFRIRGWNGYGIMQPFSGTSPCP